MRVDEEKKMRTHSRPFKWKYAIDQSVCTTNQTHQIEVVCFFLFHRMLAVWLEAFFLQFFLYTYHFFCFSWYGYRYLPHQFQLSYMKFDSHPFLKFLNAKTPKKCRPTTTTKKERKKSLNNQVKLPSLLDIPLIIYSNSVNQNSWHLIVRHKLYQKMWNKNHTHNVMVVATHILLYVFLLFFCFICANRFFYLSWRIFNCGQ